MADRVTGSRWRSASLAGVLAITSMVSVAGQSSIADAEESATLTVVEAQHPAAGSISFRFGGDLGVFRLTPTAEDDRRSFNVDPGNVRVRQQQFSSWALDDVSCVDVNGSTIDADVDLARGILNVALAGGAEVTCTFSNSRAAIINTRAGHDADRNGLLDSNESWIAGSTMDLYDADGALIKTHTTNDAGRTRFIVPAGSYRVCNTLNDGWIATNNSGTVEPGRTCKSVNIDVGEQTWPRFLSASPADPNDILDAPRASVGPDHSCGLRTDGSALCWGDRQNGILVVPDGTFLSLTSGAQFICGLRTDHTAQCWRARADSPEANPPSGAFRSISAAGSAACGLRPDASVECWGRHHTGVTNPPDRTFTKLSLSSSRACGLATDSTIVCWGAGEVWAPIDGTFIDVALGATHGCAISTAGDVQCWGTTELDRPMPAAPDGAFIELASGRDVTCGRTAAGDVTCWGVLRGEGLGDVPDGVFTRIVSAPTARHACGERADETIVCWGSNESGESTIPGGTFVDLIGTGYTLCAVAADGTNSCWMDTRTYTNQLDLTDPTRVALGDDFSCSLRADNTAACRGIAREGRTNPPDGAFVSIAAAALHACGIRLDRTVECWGRDFSGLSTPPAGEFTDLALGYRFSCGLRIDGTVACWGEAQEQQLPGGVFTSLSSSAGGVCGLRPDGIAHCWSPTNRSALVPQPGGVFTGIARGSDICGLRPDATIACFGLRGWNFDSTEVDAPAGTFTAIAASGSTMCALRTEGTVLCWGIFGNARDEAF